MGLPTPKELESQHQSILPSVRVKDTYLISFDSRKPSLKVKFALALIGAGVFFLLRLSWSYFWPSAFEEHRGHHANAMEAGIVALVWGAAMAFMPKFGIASTLRTGLPAYKLLVDDESITGCLEYNGWMKWFRSKRKIRKGRVHTIFEIKGRFGRPDAIGISERSRFVARMSGFVYIPKTLPEFDDLRRLAESWRKTEQID